MSSADAEKVHKHLQDAQEAAKPLKDPALTRKIDDAQKHVSERANPKKS